MKHRLIHILRLVRDLFVYRKVLKLVDQGKTEEAFAYLQNGLENNSRKCKLLMRLTNIFAWNSQHERNIEIGYEIIKKYNGEYECANTIWTIALLLYDEKLFEKSLPFIQFCITHWPENSIVLALQGLVYQELKDNSQAEINFQKALEIDRMNPDARYGISEIYWVTGRKRLIQNYLEEYLKIAPDMASSHIMMAQHLHLTKADAKGALPYYERGMILAQNLRLHSITPKYITTKNYPDTIYPNYIDALLGCGLDDAAREFIRNEYQGSERDAFMCDLLADTGNVNDAIALAETILSKDISFMSLRARLGLYYFQIRDFNKAKQNFEVAYKQNPKKMALYELASYIVTLVELGQFDESRHIQEFAFMRDSVVVWHFIAEMYSTVGKWELALEAANNSINASANYIWAYYEVARCKAHLGQYDEAIDLFQNFLKWQPKNGEVWFELAQIYMRNDKERALDAIYRSLETGNLSSILRNKVISLKKRLEYD